MNLQYGYSKVVEKPFGNVLNKIKEELVKEGFGILTTIDLKEKFKEKLGIDYKNYVILAACNPPSAHKAIETEENIGLMLPCNVIVYEPEEDVSVVSAINPLEAMFIVGNPKLEHIARAVGEKLKQALEAI